MRLVGYLRTAVGSAIVCIIASQPTVAASGARVPAPEVSIRRDTYGVPHILARSEEAAAYGLGYAQAEDHCLEIARLYTSARGEEAKHFGTGIEGDFLMKLYDNSGQAARDVTRLNPRFRGLVEGFVAGVNLYVERHRGELPGWIPVFTAADVLAHRRAGAIRQVFSQEVIRSLKKKYPLAASEPAGDIAKLAPETPVPPAREEAAGSNAFALAGKRTLSGKAILLGNPHLAWSSLYWEAQVTVPGKLNFFGSTLAGIPVLRAGFNERLGWVTTNNSPDLTDIFALRLDANKPDHYIFNGKSRPLKKREILLEILGDQGQTRVQKRIYWESHLGMVIYRDSARAFAVQSTLIDAFRYYEGFYLLSKSRSLHEFQSNLKKNLVPTSNFTYADVDGNILYQWNARIPRRPDNAADYKLDVPGENRKYFWRGLHKLEELPRLLNPAGGYIQNCNNPPWFTSMRDPLDPRKYPSYLEQERELALRPQAALEMLEGQEKFSFEEVMRMKCNNRMLLADRVKPDLIQALRGASASSRDLQEGLSVLESWDNSVSAGSKGGALFQRFWDSYSKATDQPFAVPWDGANPIRTPSGISDPALALRHFEEAVRWIRKTYGTPDVAWGDIHRFRFGELDLPGDGAPGTYGIFRVVRFEASDDGKLVAGRVKQDEPPVGFGDAWILLIEFSKPIRAQSVLAYGQSSRSSSKHSRDQIELFAGHRYKRVWFTEEEIKANLEREYSPDK